MSDDLVSRLQADGKLDSSGQFSWDLLRSARVSAENQLADPEHYLLRALACAVAVGSPSFRLEQGALTSHLIWRMPADPPPEPLRELSLALLTAERLGRVEFHIESGQARLTLRRSGWWHLFGRSRSLILLAERGRHARLILHPPIGEPRTARLLRAFENGWGDGQIGWGAGKTLIIRDGVSFPGPSIPGLEVVCWSSNLPLDLSRSQLVDGPELADWLSQLIGRVLTLLSHPSCPLTLKTWALQHAVGQQIFDSSAIFGLGNGKWGTFSELQQEYKSAGYLRVLNAPAPLDAVVRAPYNQAFLQKHFPHQLPIGEVKARFLRLPATEDYLLKWPMANVEIGLRDQIAMEHRQWNGIEFTGFKMHPFGVDLAGEPEGWCWWPEALTLLANMRNPDESIVQFHFLTYLLARIQIAVDGRMAGTEKIDREGRLKVWTRLSTDGVLLKQVRFQLRRGGTVCLEEIFQEGGDWLVNDPGPRGLLVDPRVAGMLQQLLTPGARVHNPDWPRFSRAASALMQGDLWSNLRDAQNCAGQRALESTGLTLDDFTSRDDWKERLPQILGASTRTATSVHLLLASGVQLPEVAVSRWGETENLEELIEDEGNYIGERRVSWWSGLAWCRARSDELESALLDLKQGLREFPDSWTLWDSLGQLQACTGQLKEAIISHRQSLRLQGSYPFFTCNLAESLWAAGQLDEARATFSAEKGLHSRLMAARLETNLVEAERACLELLEEPFYPHSVHERLGQVMAELGRNDDAREHYRRFVAARPDLVLGANITARREAAVQWLLAH